jgi:chemotaxis response regulator CheB
LRPLLPSTLDLSARVEQLKPDVILIQTDSPSRDTLEHLAVAHEELPRPVVMFANQGDARVMRLGLPGSSDGSLGPQAGMSKSASASFR